MKEYLENNLFPVLCLFVFGNVHHGGIAVITIIGRFAPDSGNGKWHTFTTSTHPSFYCRSATSTAKMWGPRFILVTHLHAKICLIGYKEFGFWYNFVLLLLWTDVIATNIAETVRRNFTRSFNTHTRIY